MIPDLPKNGMDAVHVTTFKEMAETMAKIQRPDGIGRWVCLAVLRLSN